MLRHSAADHYTLTPLECERLAAECALTIEQVSAWCRNLRYRYDSDDVMAKFLHKDPTEKVL
jgi:hypothetical protein